jgi:hypothetical protein
MKGLSIRTTSLGFRVLRLHYSCDPDKDPVTDEGKRWYDEARKGMPDARFRQEYELDYGALSGQLVFPTFEETIHVVPQQFPLDPKCSTVWMACDPHPRTAHAFLWLAVNREGEMGVVWSWWPQERHEHRVMVTKDYVEGLKELDESSLGLKLEHCYCLMDVAGRSFNATEEKNYFNVYRDEDVYFRPAKRNRDLSGYDLINEALQPREHTSGAATTLRPRLTIWEGCGDNDKLVRQMKSLRYKEWKGNVTDKDPPEEPQQKERHLVDCLSYILLDDPQFVSQEKPQSTWQPRYPAIGY